MKKLYMVSGTYQGNTRWTVMMRKAVNMYGKIRCFVTIGEEEVRLGKIKTAPVAKRRQVRMTGEVLQQILCSPIGTQMPEHGGAFGMDRKTGCITRFYFDRTAAETGGTYSPDTRAVSAAMRKWEQEGVEFCGMIHSHPAGFPQPSTYDLRYAADIIRAMPNTLTEGIMHMPIVTVNTARRTAEIRWYVAVLRADGSVRLECADLIVDGRRICGPQRVPVPRRGTRPAGSASPADHPAEKHMPQWEYDLPMIWTRW